MGPSVLEGFGDRLIRSRLELGLSQRAKITQEQLGAMVAAALGRSEPITGGTVSRWEAGLAVPDVTTIQALAQVLQVDPGWLAFGSATSAPAPIQHVDDLATAVVRMDAALAQLPPALEGEARRRFTEHRARVAAQLTTAIGWLKRGDLAAALQELQAAQALMGPPSPALLWLKEQVQAPASRLSEPSSEQDTR